MRCMEPGPLNPSLASIGLYRFDDTSLKASQNYINTKRIQYKSWKDLGWEGHLEVSSLAPEQVSAPKLGQAAQGLVQACLEHVQGW